MNTLISIIIFPLFFSLWFYCQFCEYCLMPLYTTFMRFCARLQFNMFLMLKIAEGYVFIAKSQVATYEILDGNKDLWQVWIDFFNKI